MKGMLVRPKLIPAIAERRKTQTRRLDGLKEINEYPDEWEVSRWEGEYTHTCTGDFQFLMKPLVAVKGNLKATKPRYHVGEVVYIKETWVTENQYNHLKPREIPHTAKIFYLLGGYDPFTMGKIRSPLFLMEWMARYFIKIKDVRPERLHEISDEDCKAEGTNYNKPWGFADGYVNSFAWIWDSRNPTYPFTGNYWVWRYEFELVK